MAGLIYDCLTDALSTSIAMWFVTPMYGSTGLQDRWQSSVGVAAVVRGQRPADRAAPMSWGRVSDWGRV